MIEETYFKHIQKINIYIWNKKDAMLWRPVLEYIEKKLQEYPGSVS